MEHDITDALDGAGDLLDDVAEVRKEVRGPAELEEYSLELLDAGEERENMFTPFATGHSVASVKAMTFSGSPRARSSFAVSM